MGPRPNVGNARSTGLDLFIECTCGHQYNLLHLIVYTRRQYSSARAGRGEKGNGRCQWPEWPGPGWALPVRTVDVGFGHTTYCTIYKYDLAGEGGECGWNAGAANDGRGEFLSAGPGIREVIIILRSALEGRGRARSAWSCGPGPGRVARVGDLRACARWWREGDGPGRTGRPCHGVGQVLKIAE